MRNSSGHSWRDKLSKLHSETTGRLPGQCTGEAYANENLLPCFTFISSLHYNQCCTSGLTYVCTALVRNLYRASPLWREMKWMTCTFYQPCQLQRRRIKAGQRIMFTSYCGRSRQVISAVRHAEFYVCALLGCCSYFRCKPAVIIIFEVFCSCSSEEEEERDWDEMVDSYNVYQVKLWPAPEQGITCK